MVTRAQAQTAADDCVRLLKEKFGARHVILFGSVAGQGTWHDRSDIDLAVEGLAPADFFAAYSACTDLLPKGVTIDLVPLEDAYPEMRARILGETPMSDDPAQALRDLIDDEFVALERIASQMEEALGSLTDEPSQFEMNGLAAYLHAFYTGIESIFERIALQIDAQVPRGEYWHTDLLNQMAEKQEGLRPEVIDTRLHTQLKEYLGFRHFFRHAYGYILAWTKMRWKVENLASTLTVLQNQLNTFFQTQAKKQ